MRATLVLDTKEDRLKECARLIKLLFYIVDRCVTLRLSQANRDKAEKSRKKVEKIRQKDKKEELEEEKLKKKREEDMKYKEKLKSLPPDQQRKLEEKKQKKDSKNMRSKFQKIVKF